MKFLLNQLSPAGESARLSIVIFHRVLPVPDPLFPDEIDAGRFDTVCGWLKYWFNVLPLDQAVERLKAGTLPARSLAITFDDGYADNHDVALPILQKHGLTATFFISTGFLDGGRMWNDSLIEAVRLTRKDALVLDTDCETLPKVLPLNSMAERRQALGRLIDAAKYLPTKPRLALCAQVEESAEVTLPNDLMLKSPQVIAMRDAGMQIGAHTVTHPILCSLDECEVRAEIDGSKRHLEALLGESVTLFAYPNGKPGKDFDETSVRVVKELGFAAAVSTAWGTSTKDTDFSQLPRFLPWDRWQLAFVGRMAANYLNIDKGRGLRTGVSS